MRGHAVLAVFLKNTCKEAQALPFAWDEPNSELMLYVRFCSADNPGSAGVSMNDLSWNPSSRLVVLRHLCLGSWVLRPGV